MEHQFGETPVPAEIAGARADFIESELRKLCALVGFKMEPISNQIDAYVTPAGSAPIVVRGPSYSRFDLAAQHRRNRARAVRAEIKRRRQRDQFFPPDLFADPAWDILLDLYAASYEGREISVSSACIGAAVPATTALRWLKTLCDNGQIVRVPDPDDGRRIFVAISEESLKMLDAYFEEIDER